MAFSKRRQWNIFFFVLLILVLSSSLFLEFVEAKDEGKAEEEEEEKRERERETPLATDGGGGEGGGGVENENSRCSEPRDKGVPCPAATDGESNPPVVASKQFYYNSQMGLCQPFLFNGCGGNSNRFENASACRRVCTTSEKKEDTWVLADRCNASHLIPDGYYIECDATAINGEGLQMDCPKGHECRSQKRATGGEEAEEEGGTVEKTVGVCCPTKEFLCSLADDSGTFAEGVPDKPRFAWSVQVNSCWRFSYYGAKGNYNNFPNFKECMAFCGESKNISKE